MDGDVDTVMPVFGCIYAMFVAFLGLSLLTGSWSLMLWPCIIVGSFLIGCVIGAIVIRVQRWKREVKREKTSRLQSIAEERAAIEKRAEEQNKALWEGMLNNVEDEINKALYGDYQPEKLDWPKEVA